MTTQSDGSQNSDEFPKTFAALVDLYYDRYKPLYSRIQTFNEMPVELVFEVAAAWDHLSRHWRFGESEVSCIDKAARHIKRAVFDTYKLLLKHAVDDYDELRKIDTSLINNGNYDRELRQLMAKIADDAITARTAEGDTGGPDGWSRAFALWNIVYQQIETFHRKFYLSPHVDWARSKTVEFTVQRRWEGVWIGVASGIVGSCLFAAAAWFLTRFIS